MTSESRPSLEQLMQQAQQQQSADLDLRKQNEASAEAALVDGKIQGIEETRSEQITIQADIERLAAENREAEERLRQMEAQRAKAREAQAVATKNLYDKNLSAAARSLYEQVQSAAQEEVEGLTTQIATVQSETSQRNLIIRENSGTIDTSTAAVAETVINKREQPNFDAVADYVEKARVIADKAGELLKSFDADKVAEVIKKKIEAVAKKKQYGEDVDAKLDTADLCDVIKPQEMESFVLSLQNPYVVTEIKNRLLALVDAKSKAVEDITKEDRDSFNNVASAKVILFNHYSYGQGKDKDIKIWDGVTRSWLPSKRDEFVAKPVDAEKLPFDLSQDDKYKITPEQWDMIQAAIKDPSVPLRQLKADMGITFEPEVLGQIKSEAEAANQEVDRQREIKQLTAELAKINADIQQSNEELTDLKGEIEKIQQQVEILKKNQELIDLKSVLSRKVEETQWNLKEIAALKTKLAALPKTFFGNRPKDTAKEAEINKGISEREEILEKLAQKGKDLDERIQALVTSLGDNLMEDSRKYPIYQQIENTESSLGWKKTDAVLLGKKLSDLKKKSEEVEQKLSQI